MKIEYCKHMKAGQDLMRIADQLPEQISEEAPERYSDTRGNIESGKQGRCSTPEIVVGVTFQISKAHGKGGLTALQGLASALFVHTQNERVGRGTKVEGQGCLGLFLRRTGQWRA
jgi:hypothetical protein